MVLPVAALGILNICMLAISDLIIHCYRKRTTGFLYQSGCISIKNNRFFFKRVLFVITASSFVFILLIYLKVRGDHRAPAEAHVATLVFNLIILMLLLDKDVFTFTKRRFYQLLLMRNCLRVRSTPILSPSTHIFVINIASHSPEMVAPQTMNQEAENMKGKSNDNVSIIPDVYC
jgi:hypothetical protein